MIIKNLMTKNFDIRTKLDTFPFRLQIKFLRIIRFILYVSEAFYLESKIKQFHLTR